MLAYTKQNRIESARLEDVRLYGSIAAQMDEFFHERVLSDYAHAVIYQETEDAFRAKRDDETIVGIWQGEFWGKWVISASRVYRYTGDEKLKEFLRQGARNMLSMQREDGYIGTYRDSKNVFAPNPDDTEKICGWRSNWNWNIWCRKYTLWGLLEIYQITRDEAILRGAIRFADHIISELAELGAHLQDVGTFNGLPAFSILKPMLILYRLTGDEKYRAFCQENADLWDRPDGKIPNLLYNALSGKPLRTWYPNSELWAKAYEMMSCIDGIIELHRVTGNPHYLDVAKAMFVLLRDYEGNPVCNVGFNDIFANGANWINGGTEPCDVIHWMRIAHELFKLTGDIQYMNAFERAFYNPFLAASFRGGRWGGRVIRTSGCHVFAKLQAKMEHSHCCVNNMPRGYLNACESFIMASRDAVYVNLYTDFKGTVRTDACCVEVGIWGSYLRDGHVRLHIRAQAPVRMELRIPDWSEHTEITWQGEKLCPTRNSYYAIECPAGESEIAIAFDMRARLEQFKGSVERIAPEDFRVRRWIRRPDCGDEGAMVWERKSRLFYGALLLTRSKLCGNTEEEMFGMTALSPDSKVTLTPIPADGLHTKFRAAFDSNGKIYETTVCDFASGSNLETEDNRLFNIYF